MDEETNPDFLSDLPLSIIESILTLLPTRDVIKMSVLSTKWRYRWASLPQLVFNDECVSRSSDKPVIEDMLIKFITHALLLHKGPIIKFKISSSVLQNCPEVDQWLLFLSRNNVRELTLEFNEGEWFTVPSCLFSCKKLTHLELRGCNIDPPANFKGFLCLRTLNLQPVLMNPEDIERLISSCPLLENLTLLYYNGSDLSIRAPNLKYLYLGGEFNELCIEESPLLKVMSVTFYMDYDDEDVQEYWHQSSGCNFVKILGGVRDLERLVGHLYFTKYLSLGIEQWKPSRTFSRLTVIELYQVSFEDIKEIMVVLQLIINSPNLQEFHISGSPNTLDDVDTPKPEFWEIEYPSSCTFKHLKNAKMTDVCGMPHEMELIKFLLQNSPALEKLSITPCIYVTEGRLGMLLELVRFRRASPLAEILFNQE